MRAEIWEVIGPQIEQVMGGGEATWHEDHLVPITRDGALDEVYWTYSYGPIDEEAAPARVGGVLVLVTETTKKVLAARKLADERDGLWEASQDVSVVIDGEAGFWRSTPRLPAR